MKTIMFCHDSLLYKVKNKVYDEFMSLYKQKEKEEEFIQLLDKIKNEYIPIAVDVLITDSCY